MIKVSAIQMTSTSTVTENLSAVAYFLKCAAAEKSNLVVLPEMFPICAPEASWKLKMSERFGEGPIQDFLAQQARKHGVWIVSGTIPIRENELNRVKAANIVYTDKGEVAGRYDKMHLFDVTISDQESYQESASTIPGSSVTVIPTPFGKLGLSVCYDIRFPELYRKMFQQGAEIITIPAAFTMKTGKAHWEILARSRAIENFCYVIGACQTGVHQTGRETYGHSLIINPWGEVLQCLKKDVGVITAGISLEKLAQIRRDMPIASHQKIYIA